MDVYEEELALAFDGPLEAAIGIPAGILYGVLLTLAHGGGRKALDAVRSALEAVLGPARVSPGWLADRLDFGGRFTAQVRQSEIRVQALQRAKGRQVAEVLRGLANVPGAGRVQVRAEVRRYGGPGSRDGPILDG